MVVTLLYVVRNTTVIGFGKVQSLKALLLYAKAFVVVKSIKEIVIIGPT
jgi:hypothetical protein